MSISVNYLGILAEKAGNSSDNLETIGLKSSVINLILEKYPVFRELSFVVSLNGVIIHEETEIKTGDQLTLIPPPPGG